MNRRCYNLVFATVVVAMLGGVLVQPARALSGAIWTTDKNGNIVNGNIYRNKCDVYLNGGPGPNAPIGAAGLPEGWYYFQVTDPSGKVLLSTDAITERRIWVSDDGVFTVKVWASPDGDGREYPIHEYGDDKGEKNGFEAIVVQLCPFLDTPNNGGVYKVWVTPVDAYDETEETGRFGFVPKYSKTDNFKVGRKAPEQYLHVRKFKDCNADGFPDGDDPLGDWELIITPPDGPIIEGEVTPYDGMAWPGEWEIEEIVTPGWIQTGVLVDGTAQPLGAAFVTFGTKDEEHWVAFGNIPTGCVTACKFYDRNANGVLDDGEPGIQGVKVILTGSDVTGLPVYSEGYTDSDGQVEFCGLLPGTYTVTEIVPTNCNWVPTTNTSATVELACEEEAQAGVGFGNIITGYADFDTKGYWHNKNGLAELDEDDRSYVNGLDPYDEPSLYFGAGDEPFDGTFEGGAPVAAAFNDDGTAAWAAGTWQSEVSHFLTDNNGNANLNDHKEQLAQQLLAFIFNVRHRLGADAMIYVDGQWVSTAGLIADAIAVWAGFDDAAIVEMTGNLDALNNNDAVEFILDGPGSCAPAGYPAP